MLAVECGRQQRLRAAAGWRLRTSVCALPMTNSCVGARLIATAALARTALVETAWAVQLVGRKPSLRNATVTLVAPPPSGSAVTALTLTTCENATQ